MKVIFLQIDLYEGLIMDQQQKEIDVDDVTEHNCHQMMEMFVDDKEAVDYYMEQGQIDPSSNCFLWKGEENMIIMSWKFK